MSDCMKLRFGKTNVIPLTNAYSGNSSLTNIDWIKNNRKSQVLVFPDASPSDTVTLWFELPDNEIKSIDYISLLGHNLSGLVQARYSLHSTAPAMASNQTYTTAFAQIADYKPLGLWEAGVDAFGLADQDEIPEVLTHWFDKTYNYNTLRVTLSFTPEATALLGTDGIRITQIVAGEKLVLENNFEHGHNIRFFSEPELEITSSGSHFLRRYRQRSRAWSFSLDVMNAHDRRAMWELEKFSGDQPFIVDAFPGHTGWQRDNYSFLAMFGNSLNFRHTSQHLHKTDILLVEA